MNVTNQLALSLRPKRFSELIGQDKVVRRLRGLLKKRVPKCYLFHGPKGTGKTTIARILAVSLQCRHQKEFGEPCDKCRRRYKRSELPITEINCASIVEKAKDAAKMSAAQAIRDKLSATSYELLQGRFRVYILDEAHRLSADAQDAALKYFEDSPKENIFIVCSTRAHNIVDTLRSRCMLFKIKPLEPDTIKVLVKRGLSHLHSDLSSSKLADALWENRIDSPRLILNAVENYVAGDSPEEAAEVEAETVVDSKELCRCIVKHDWPRITKILRQAPPSDARGLRAAVVGYLREIMLDTSDVTEERSIAVSDAIRILCASSWTEDSNQLALLIAELAAVYKVLANFGF